MRIAVSYNLSMLNFPSKSIKVKKIFKIFKKMTFLSCMSRCCDAWVLKSFSSSKHLNYIHFDIPASFVNALEVQLSTVKDGQTDGQIHKQTDRQSYRHLFFITFCVEEFWKRRGKSLPVTLENFIFKNSMLWHFITSRSHKEHFKSIKRTLKHK
jgi:hypothetical protein